MENTKYYDDLIDSMPEVKEPPGIMIYKDMMLPLALIPPERCGVVMQNVFDNILHGYSAIDLSLSELETDLINSILQRHADDTVKYQEKYMKSREASRKAAERRARRNS